MQKCGSVREIAHTIGPISSFKPIQMKNDEDKMFLVGCNLRTRYVKDKIELKVIKLTIRVISIARELRLNQFIKNK